MKISSVADKGHKGIILMCFGIFAFPLWFVVPVGIEQDVVAGGGEIFTEYCARCHGDGTGDVGPDLTDRQWTYGGWYSEVYDSVARGRPGGMPSWLYILGKDDIKKVISYVRSIKCEQCQL
jgi:cbb3-type cytochrome c oxidase subunit III